MIHSPFFLSFYVFVRFFVTGILTFRAIVEEAKRALFNRESLIEVFVKPLILGDVEERSPRFTPTNIPIAVATDTLRPAVRDTEARRGEGTMEKLRLEGVARVGEKAVGGEGGSGDNREMCDDVTLVEVVSLFYIFHL